VARQRARRGSSPPRAADGDLLAFGTGRLVRVFTNASLHKGTLCSHSLEVLAVVLTRTKQRLIWGSIDYRLAQSVDRRLPLRALAPGLHDAVEAVAVSASRKADDRGEMSCGFSALRLSATLSSWIDANVGNSLQRRDLAVVLIGRGRRAGPLETMKCFSFPFQSMLSPDV